MNTSLVVILQIVPQHLAAFLEILQAHGERSLEREEGCLRFEAMLSIEDPNQVILVEVYTNDAALEVHWASTYMNEYRQAVQDMIVSRVVHRCHMSI